jgi:biotin-(acetyl-CoA carboxylase) ligase
MAARPADGTGRGGSAWAVAGGVAAAIAVGLATDARVGSYALAALLVVCAVLRAVLPGRRPAGLAVRARWIDVAVLAGLAALLAVLATIVPMPS